VHYVHGIGAKAIRENAESVAESAQAIGVVKAPVIPIKIIGVMEAPIIAVEAVGAEAVVAIEAVGAKTVITVEAVSSGDEPIRA
jgi:hypothetical protein